MCKSDFSNFNFDRKFYFKSESNFKKQNINTSKNKIKNMKQFS